VSFSRLRAQGVSPAGHAQRDRSAAIGAFNRRVHALFLGPFFSPKGEGAGNCRARRPAPARVTLRRRFALFGSSASRLSGERLGHPNRPGLGNVGGVGSGDSVGRGLRVGRTASSRHAPTVIYLRASATVSSCGSLNKGDPPRSRARRRETATMNSKTADSKLLAVRAVQTRFTDVDGKSRDQIR